ncbi:hypothetical protein ACH4F6_30600 [Streptomyces sp. NPDC017936]|uniref:hypothetical protein n=1 Tax=Streptomyces sp. NPDC017936 TaxID=3365016 RepID=UPI0037B1C128
MPSCDDTVPEQAVFRPAAALSARLGVEAAQPLAAVFSESQRPSGPARWTTAQGGVRVDNGRYSFHNPGNDFALADDRLARVSAALTP